MTEFDPARTPDEVADRGPLPPVEVDVGTPDADALEQARPVGEEPSEEPPADAPAEADPADVVEQHRDVDADDEDYR
ncbi:MAG: hypothetical protein HOV94_11015 [Saccharothrix sp.]|nr:hypothetical protein [Saccharothrix sp.]